MKYFRENTSNKIFIAEVKIKSPFTKLNRPKSFFRLLTKAKKYGDMVSIHVDPEWNGNTDDILLAKAIGGHRKILAKGIHRTDSEIENSLNCGADRVLVVGRIPRQSLLPYCYIEPTSIEQAREFAILDNFATHNVLTMVWNSRNLVDGSMKAETISDIRDFYSGMLIQASNIKEYSDVSSLCDGFIVGTHLEKFLKSK